MLGLNTDKMQFSKLAVGKYVVIVCIILGLVGWNVHLQRNQQLEESDSDNSDAGSLRLKRSSSGVLQSQSPGGAVYIRWGRSTCPDDESELVYTGVAGGSYFADTSGGAEYLCLTRDVQYGTKTTTTIKDYSARMYGAELEQSPQHSPSGYFDTKNSAPSALHDSDVICSVCRSKARSTQLMIPGRKECYPGWKKEYWGYLMTEANHATHKAWHSYACVDEAPEAEEKGHANDDGALMYHVQGICGSLPCPHYVNGYVLTCVVCTK